MILMLNIQNLNQYKLYQQSLTKLNRRELVLYDKIIPLLIFGIIGALGWAIRGTAGFGGITGGLVAGLMIGSFFYYLAYLRGIDARFQMFALGLGLGIGGINGYAQFTNWIRGDFYINRIVETLPINPVIGFMWLFILGIEWGGVAGIMLGWTISKKENIKIWFFRIITPVFFYFIGSNFVIWNKSWIYPYYSDDLYLGGLCTKNCLENDAILPIIGGLLFMFVSMCFVEKVLKNTKTIKYSLLMGLFFGSAFAITSSWLFLNSIIPGFDWWKSWEESIGFFGGLSIGIVFLKASNLVEFDKQDEIGDELVGKSRNSINKQSLWNKYLISNISLIIMVFLLLGGMSRSLCQILKFDLVDYIDDILKSPCRILIYTLSLIGCLIYIVYQYCKGKKKEKNDGDLFSVKNINNKMIMLLTFFAFTGMVAVNSIKLMITYFIFYWMILLLMIMLQNKIPLSSIPNERKNS